MAIRKKTLRQQALSIQNFLDLTKPKITPLLHDILKTGYFDDSFTIEEANVYFRTSYKESFVMAYKKKHPNRRAVYIDPFDGMSTNIPYDTDDGKQAYKHFCKQFGV